jgi:hypothetical protein
VRKLEKSNKSLHDLGLGEETRRASETPIPGVNEPIWEDGSFRKEDKMENILPCQVRWIYRLAARLRDLCPSRRLLFGSLWLFF